MLVNKSFLRDFAELANLYEWDGSVLEDVKEQTRNSPELKLYWQRLAKAHRNGYTQTRENNWERLECWTQLKKENKL